MARQKFDGVIEAVRYTPDGKIEFVRAYERRGGAFSDHVLIDRPSLLEKLKSGKRFVTGERKILWAGSFEVGKPVKLIGRNGSQVVTTTEQSERDLLEDVPVF
jgi:hypothetical protein